MVPALQYYQNMINLNETFMADITETAWSCGFTDFHDKYTTSFPPPGPIPTAPDSSAPGCDLRSAIYNATYYTNPCFNIYHLVEYCPYLYDELGFPSLGGGPNNYFNRIDVKRGPSRPKPHEFLGMRRWPEPLPQRRQISPIGPWSSSFSDRTNEQDHHRARSPRFPTVRKRGSHYNSEHDMERRPRFPIPSFCYTEFLRSVSPIPR